LERCGGTIYTSPLVATHKPGITNKRQFSSNSPMRFRLSETAHETARRAVRPKFECTKFSTCIYRCISVCTYSRVHSCRSTKFSMFECTKGHQIKIDHASPGAARVRWGAPSADNQIPTAPPRLVGSKFCIWETCLESPTP
jgi:hypothetical protein